MKARRYCWTLNNPTDEERRAIRAMDQGGEVRYLVCGNEIASTGTPHLQGYMELRTPQRVNHVKRLLGSERVHMEACRGTPDQNVQYCKKEGDVFHEFGTVTGHQGRRTDLLEVQELLDSGEPLVNVARSHFGAFCRYSKALCSYLALHAEPRNFRTQVVWHYGRTGSGKSKGVYEESEALCPGSVCWLPDQTLAWFDGYSGHKGVVIDDFDGRAPIALLLRLFDRYPLKVPVKGSFVEWRPRIVWITSNESPRSLYGHQNQFDALLRRVDEIKEVN
ncbi:MAG: putative viral replication protein [Circoviridae sp.]|nr:MAG: putative viral replication protein [Circoviridae sp.]